MSDKMTKRVSLAQVVEDLRSGFTRWKKDDIGFGSLEKKYNLTLQEATELFSHPKIKNVESRIPTFVIEDDIPDTQTEVRVEVEAPIKLETRVEVQPEPVRPEPVRTQQATIVVKKEVVEEQPVLVPFI